MQSPVCIVLEANRDLSKKMPSGSTNIIINYNIPKYMFQHSIPFSVVKNLIIR